MRKKKEQKVIPTVTKAAGNDRILLLFLVLVSVVLYANTLVNGFVFDDQVMVTNNKFVTKGISAIPQLLSTPHQFGYGTIHNDEYRPLSLVIFAIIFQFFELNALPYHLLNILVFAGGVVLLFRFLVAVLGKEQTYIAFIASLLFAVHPVHTEVVANIKSCDELMCFALAIGSFLLFLRYAIGGKVILLVCGVVCFFLSLLSKETAVTFNAIIPFVLFLHGHDRKRSVVISVLLLIATATFLAIRYKVLVDYHVYNPSQINVIENALVKKGLPYESRLATAILIMGYYLKLLLIPYPLLCDYSVNTIHFTHFSDPLVLLTVSAYIALAGLMIYRLAKDRKDRLAFGIFFFIATIVLFSNIFVTIKATLGERFLYFPSVGYCLVFAVLLERLGSIKKTVIAYVKQPGIAVVLVFAGLSYSAITIARNLDWKDDMTLFSTDVEKAPENARLQFFVGYNLFVAAKKTDNPDAGRSLAIRSLDYLSRSAVLCPDYFFIETNLGATYFYLNRFDSAEVHNKKALALEPEDINGANNLAAVSIRLKKYRQGVDVCMNALRFDKNNFISLVNLGVCYYKLDQYDLAIYYLNRAIAIDPAAEAPYGVLARVYKDKGIPDSARKYEFAEQQFNPRFHLN